MENAIKTIVSALQYFLEKYLLVFSVSYKIFRSPYSFGLDIADSPKEMKRSLGYCAESYLLFFVIVQSYSNDFLSSSGGGFPFALELTALYVVFFAIVSGLVFAWLMGFISQRKRKYFSSVSAHLYYYGSIMLAIFVFMVLDSFGTKTHERGFILTILFLLIGFYALYSYFAIYRWTADIYQIGLIKAFFVHGITQLILVIIFILPFI